MKKRIKLLKTYRNRPAGVIMDLPAMEANNLVKEGVAQMITAADKGRK